MRHKLLTIMVTLAVLSLRDALTKPALQLDCNAGLKREARLGKIFFELVEKQIFPRSNSIGWQSSSSERSESRSTIKKG